MSSAESSPASATRAGKSEGAPSQTPKGVTLTQACNAAAVELRASRALIAALENENALLKERIETEKRATALLIELSDTRKSESEALQTAIAAKNETIFAKDAVIASQDRLIETLKSKKSTPWKRLGDVLIGVAAGVILR